MDHIPSLDRRRATVSGSAAQTLVRRAQIRELVEQIRVGTDAVARNPPPRQKGDDEIRRVVRE